MKMMFETAPTTRRGATFLSRAYGFSNPAALAASLPPRAVAADFGAGNSNLGLTITRIRPDVTWFNIDRRVGKIRARSAMRRSDGRLHYIQADVCKPPLFEKSCDRVYSSWMLPHISLDSKELAVEAVHSMARLLKADGELATNTSYGLIVPAQNYYDAPDEIAELVSSEMQMDPMTALVMRANNFLAHMASVSYLND